MKQAVGRANNSVQCSHRITRDRNINRHMNRYVSLTSRSAIKTCSGHPPKRKNGADDVGCARALVTNTCFTKSKKTISSSKDELVGASDHDDREVLFSMKPLERAGSS